MGCGKMFLIVMGFVVCGTIGLIIASEVTTVEE